VRRFLEESFPGDKFIVPKLADIQTQILHSLEPIQARGETVKLPSVSQDVLEMETSRLCGPPYT
jgi:hypothetical protein